MLSREPFYQHYKDLYDALKEIIKLSEERIIKDEPDELFIENVNFFVKSYLVNICTYLEAYLQDVAFAYAGDLAERAKEAEIPHNFVYWRTVKNVKENELDFKNVDFSVERQEISDSLSADPYRTIKLFRYLGIDLISQDGFQRNKDTISLVVRKRNSIVHQNDQAADITFSDLLLYIDSFLSYMKSIDDLVTSMHKNLS